MWFLFRCCHPQSDLFQSFYFILCIYPTQACLSQSRTSVTTALFVLKLFHFPKCILWRSFLFKTFDKQLHQVVKGRRYMPNTCCSAPELILLNFFKCIFLYKYIFSLALLTLQSGLAGYCFIVLD